MKNLNKVLSVLLAGAMATSLMGAAFAADVDFGDADKINNTEAVEVMTALGVIQGDENGNFNPEGKLTRETAAKIIAYMLLGEDGAEALSVTSAPFSDVAATRWSAPYIAYCVEEGIVAGDGSGKFNPTGELTSTQFAKMCLVALGYSAKHENMTGDAWAINTSKLAVTVGLNDNIGALTDKTSMTREQAAQMAFNVLTSTLVEYSGGVDVSTSDTEINIGAVRSEVGVYAEAAADSYYSVAGTKTATPYTQFCEMYCEDLELDVDVDDYNLPANNWELDGTAIGTYVDSSAILTVYTDTVGDVTQGDLYKFCAKGTTTLDVYENGTQNSTVSVAKGNTTKALTSYAGATVYVVDSDNDGKADSVAVKYPYIAEITKVTEATAKADRTVTMQVWNDNAGTATTGVTYETEDFKKGDFVLVYVDGQLSTTESMNAATLGSNILDVQAAEVVTGKVSTVSGTNGSAVSALTVDNTKYNLAAATMATKGLDGASLVNANSFGFKNEYTLYLSNGYIMGVDGDATAANIDNIVYVTAAAYQVADSYGTDVYYVQTVKLDGTVENVKITDQSTGKDAQGTPAAFAAGFYTKSVNSTDSTLYDFVPASAYGSIDGSSVFYGTDTTAASAQEMKSSSTKLSLTGATKGYLTSTTRIIYVNGTKSSLTTSYVEGPVKQSVAASSKVLLSKDSEGNYVIEALIVGAKKTNNLDTVVYIDGTKKGSNANGDEYEMYDIATGEKTIATVSAAPTAGFATYSVDEDGVYTFTNVSSGYNATTANMDGSHKLTASLTKRGTLLNETTASDANLSDAEAKDAKIINLVDDTELSLADLANATSLTAVAYVKDEVVTSIVVTAYTA